MLTPAAALAVPRAEGAGRVERTRSAVDLRTKKVVFGVIYARKVGQSKRALPEEHLVAADDGVALPRRNVQSARRRGRLRRFEPRERDVRNARERGNDFAAHPEGEAFESFVRIFVYDGERPARMVRIVGSRVDRFDERGDGR